MKLVFVDDEIRLLALYKNIFEFNGHNVKIFSCPQEAIEYISENKKEIDFVVTDYDMNKEITGSDVLNLAVKHKIKCAMVSGTLFIEKEIKETIEKKIPFVEKPFAWDELYKIIEGEYNEKN